MEDRKKLWDGNTNNPRPPRRPNSDVNSFSNTNNENLQGSRSSLNFSNTSNDSTSSEANILSTTKLSVNAKEWYPKDHNKSAKLEPAISSSSFIQDRLTKFKIHSENENKASGMEVQAFSDTSEEISRDLVMLQDIICKVMQHPEKYDNLIGSFLNTFYVHSQDKNFVIKLAEVIIVQALDKYNSRYNAAKLCAAVQDSSLFQSELCMLLSSKMIQMPYNSNLALFLAELYVNFNYNNLYGQFLIDYLNNILTQANRNDIIAVCQVLKLTGSSLELHHKDALNNIFTRLTSLTHISLLAVKNLIDNVVALRNSNWGKNKEDENNAVEVNEGNGTQQPNFSDDFYVFYNPDCIQLTEEEQQFLDENVLDDPASPNGDLDPNDLYDSDSEMDEEMQAAFEEFLRLRE